MDRVRRTGKPAPPLRESMDRVRRTEKPTAGAARCSYCFYVLDDRTRKLHVCTAPQSSSRSKNQVDEDFQSDDYRYCPRGRPQQDIDLEKGHGAGHDNVGEHQTGNSCRDFVQSDVESSVTDLRRYNRNQRRLQETIDLKKGREGVGGARNGGRSSGTKNAQKDQSLDLEKGSQIQCGSANAPTADTTLDHPAVARGGDDWGGRNTAWGFLQHFWRGFWPRRAPDAPGSLLDTAFEGGGGTKALDATRVAGTNVETRKQNLDNERREGSTQKESERQYNKEEVNISRKDEIERRKQWDRRRKRNNARKTWEGSRSTEEESERHNEEMVISRKDEIERRKHRDIRRKRDASTWEGSSETESERQYDEHEIAILRRDVNERRKQRDARKNRNVRKTFERQLGYEVRAKGIMDWLNGSTEMKKQLGRIRHQELNAKRREDLLNERRALTRADLRRELQRESLEKQKKKWQNNIEDLQDERLQLRKRRASVKILWWLSIVLDGVIMTCLDFYLEVVNDKFYWFVFAVYVLLFFLWWRLISQRQQKLEGPPQAVEFGAGFVKMLCIVALKMVLLKKLLKEDSLGYHGLKCFFYVGARTCSSYALLLVTLEKLEKEDQLIEEGMKNLMREIANAELEIISEGE